MGFATLLTPDTVGQTLAPMPALMALAAAQAEIIAIGAAPPAGGDLILQRVEHIRRAAGDRFADLELNLNLFAAGERPDPSLLSFLRLDLDELVRAGSPFVLIGTPDQ